MFGPTSILSVIQRFAQTFYIAVFLMALIVFSIDARAQDSLRNSVYKIDKPKSQSINKSKSLISKSSINKRSFQPPAKKSEPAQTSKTTPKRSRKRIMNNLLSVTFKTNQPRVEVWLNDKNIGLTNANLQLIKQLAPGEYRVMAKTKNQIIFPMKRIVVSAGQTAFELFAENAAGPNNQPKTRPAQPEKKSDLQIAQEVSARISEILANYANPGKTDTVTQDDWELVFQTAQLGQLQGYTAVQIEAQRWFASGQIELAKNALPNAFTAFNKASEYMPNSALPFYALGNTYLASRQPADALKSYRRALQFDSKMAMIYRGLGDAQRLLGKEKEAVGSYKTALQLGYQTPETRYWLGAMLLETKQTEAAIRQLEEVAKETPKAEIFISIGDAYEKLKRDVSAIENYNKAINVDSTSAVAHYKLGSVYLEQREFSKAKTAFEKAIELDAGGKNINRAEAQKKLREATLKLN